MQRPSTPLLGLLAATVIVAILYVTVLKGGSSSSSSTGIAQFQGDINSAKNAVSVSAKSDAASAGTTVSAAPTTAATAAAPSTAITPSATPATSSTPVSTTVASTTPATTASAASGGVAPVASATGPTGATGAVTATSKRKALGPLRTPAEREKAVINALRGGRVLALLFYNPGAADDQANVKELKTIPTDHGAIFKLAIPISELSHYGAVTNQVPVSVSPTLVIIDRQHYATTIVGYASRAEIAQRIADANAVPTAV